MLDATEEGEDLPLQRCDFGIEDLDEIAVAVERVVLREGEFAGLIELASAGLTC